MNAQELIQLFKGEQDFFAGLADLKEVVLYGSALVEDEIRTDINLLVIPSRDMGEGEKVDLRQEIWSKFKDRVSVMLDVQVASDELSRATLDERGVAIEPIYSC